MHVSVPTAKINKQLTLAKVNLRAGALTTGAVGIELAGVEAVVAMFSAIGSLTMQELNGHTRLRTPVYSSFEADETSVKVGF